MKIELFDYQLPKELIAQHPEKDRSSSRLLVYHRKTGKIEHRLFKDIDAYLVEGDVLVLNESKVLPARLKMERLTGGMVELLLTEMIDKRRWKCLVKGIKAKKGDTEVSLGDIKAIIRWIDGSWVCEFINGDDVFDIIDKHGRPPLPPYIKRKDGARDENGDLEKYQTVYARIPGSIAAPTAGFHFTEGLLKELTKKGIIIVKLTLHIGIGTFLLIKAEDVERHTMHREFYDISPSEISCIRQAKTDGRRVICCGTSVVRTLETICMEDGNSYKPLAGFTELFIYPGYRFKVVDGLITNFHLPRSTPLLLVSAFTGHEELLKCYKEAIEKRYRFYSYGDAMLIL